MSLKITQPIYNKRVALIDGDILRYRIGFACEKDGVAEPLENCLHSVKLQLDSILGNTECYKYEVYLTGKNNFREEIAVTRKYKGNRPNRKPIHYDSITDYLTEVWNAKTIDGWEADDELSIRQGELEESVICTLDKDLDMVVGDHYNFVHDSSYYIDYISGMRLFFKQMITGDTTDNIPGLPRKGKKAAEVLDEFDSDKKMYEQVKEMYLSLGMNEHYFDEQAQLLWMLRDRQEKWTDVKKNLEE